MSTGKSMKIVIIGGGVIGLSAAYHLAKLGGASIILLEKEQLGAGASSRAGGIITGLLWTKTGIEARKISLQLYRQLSDELAAYGYRFHGVGCLNLCGPAEWREREKLLPLYDTCDMAYQVLDAKTISRCWQGLRTRGDHIGLFDPLGGYSEPDQYIPALARRCRDLGVDIREHKTVTGFSQRRGKISGVVLSDQLIEADMVICTVHSWTNRLLASLGKALPMKSFVHQRYLTKPLSEPVQLPAVNANPYGAYLRPALGNRLLIGGETPKRNEFDLPAADFRMAELSAPDGFRAQLRQQVLPVFPALAELEWESEQVGLICFSMDGEPILGALPELPGLLVAGAFHSGGFAYNPVAGLLLAQLALTGETELDIGSFSPGRFAGAAVDEYLNSKLRQEDAFARRH